MKKQFQLFKRATLLSLLLGVLVVGVAFAITITVDGDRESAWSGGGGQTPGTINDPNENGTPPNTVVDNVDIQTFQWTNDATTFYFLVDVWDVAPLMPALAPIDICLDSDNNVSTSIPAGNTIYQNRCAYPSGVTGIDRIIEAYRLPSGVLLVDVYNAAVYPMTYLGAGLLGYNPAATTPVVEISVPVSLLGFGSGVCPSSIPTVLYYDGGDSNIDDNLPDSGTVIISCGAPTAITLESLSARNTNNLVAIGVAGVLVLGGAMILLRRRKTITE